MSERRPDTTALARTLLSRRAALKIASAGSLSVPALALLGGRDRIALAAGQDVTEEDISVLNTALSAEYEAIAAYGFGVESDLLRPASRDLAVAFQGHHREHADALAATIARMGGTPGKPASEYAFGVEGISNEADVLSFAASLEKGAVSAYLGAIPLFADRELAKVAGSILGDEAMHWAVLRYALGQAPVPGAFVS